MIEHQCLLGKLRVTRTFARPQFNEIARLANLALEMRGSKGTVKTRFAYSVERNAFICVVKLKRRTFFMVIRIQYDWPEQITASDILSAGVREYNARAA